MLDASSPGDLHDRSVIAALRPNVPEHRDRSRRRPTFGPLASRYDRDRSGRQPYPSQIGRHLSAGTEQRAAPGIEFGRFGLSRNAPDAAAVLSERNVFGYAARCCITGGQELRRASTRTRGSLSALSTGSGTKRCCGNLSVSRRVDRKIWGRQSDPDVQGSDRGASLRAPPSPEFRTSNE